MDATLPQLSETGLLSARSLIEMALEEDLQSVGDLTSRATIPPGTPAQVNVVARENGHLCGAALIEPVYAALCRRMKLSEDAVTTTLHLHDGQPVSAGTHVATISGPVDVLLTGERIALNFLIHLSGIASLTGRFVAKTEGTGATVLDTRKTLPGYRWLHKYAVRCGGGTNHRMGLYDGMLIKDNHLAARGNQSVAAAVEAGRNLLRDEGLNLPVEVEVDTLEQLRDALVQKPEIVLLDNMKPPQLQQAVAIRNEVSEATLLEASGGINMETIGCISATGVDRISIGALTHSAPSLDLGYDWPWKT